MRRFKEARNEMEKQQEAKTMRRIFTPEQKFEILRDIERCKTIKEGLMKHQLGQSLYHTWKRQLEVGVRASLRNSRPLKTTDLRRIETLYRARESYKEDIFERRRLPGLLERLGRYRDLADETEPPGHVCSQIQ